MTTGQADWRTDFATALTLSTAAVIALTGLLTLTGLPQPVTHLTDQFCSITSCLVSDDGRSLLLTYWQTDQGHESPRRGVAQLNLGEPGCTLQALPTEGQPWRLARLGSRAYFAADSAGRMILRSVHGRSGSAGDVWLPASCTAELVASADGTTLVAWVLGKLQVFDVAQQRLRWELEGDIECFVYDARCGLYAALDGRIVELSLEKGEVLRTITAGSARTRALAISPGGESLAWLDWSGVVGMLRLCDGQPLWRQTDHAAGTLPATHRPVQYGRVLTFSDDGRYLATAAREGEWVIAVWNTRTGVRVRTLRGHDGTINGAAFLPDGSLASWSADGTLRLWNVRRGAVRRVFRAQELPPLDASESAGAA